MITRISSRLQAVFSAPTEAESDYNILGKFAVQSYIQRKLSILSLDQSFCF